MATISNISGNTFLLSLSAAESINLFFVDFTTGYVSSSFLDSASSGAISASLTPVLNGLTSQQKTDSALNLLLSCVTIAGLNGSVNLSASSSGAGYNLVVTAVAAVTARVTVAATIQGGFVGGLTQNSSGSGSSVSTSYFTSSGTWSKPAGAQWVRVVACSGGAGGGSGRSGIAGENRYGGGGGAPGNIVDMTFPASYLPASVTVTIGAGGAGGAAVGGAGAANGNGGSPGGSTTFGTSVFSVGALGGFGGSTGSGNGGSAVTSSRVETQITQVLWV
jgi:hypothetical protein